MRALVTVVATTLALGIAPIAAAQGGMGGGPPLDEANFRPTVPMLTTMLGLSTEQAARIAPFRDTLLAQTATQRKDALAARTALREARQTGVAGDSLDALRTKMQGIMMSMMPARMQFVASIRPLLTPAQAKTLDEHQQEMLGTMSQRMGRQP